MVLQRLSSLLTLHCFLSLYFILIPQINSFPLTDDQLQEAGQAPQRQGQSEQQQEEKDLRSTFKQLIAYLENVDLNGEEIPVLITRQDDDEEKKVDPVPGIAALIFGILNGDLRRIVEDGAFSFIPSKDAQNIAFGIFHGILGKSTTEATTPTTTTPKPTTSTASTLDPDEEGEEKEKDKEAEATTQSSGPEKSTKRPPIKYHSVGKTSGQVVDPQTKRPESITVKIETATVATSSKNEEAEDEDDLVARFEEALRPFVPANLDDDGIKQLYSKKTFDLGQISVL